MHIVNIILIVVVLYFAKSVISDFTANPVANSANEPAVQTQFVPQTLAKFNGKDDPKVLLAVKGVVYDVSNGKSFYGPGGPYENFAGRDASRGLAYNSFDPSVLTPLNEPIDLLEDLKDDEKESLENWANHFEMKYKKVGTLHNPDELAK